MIKHADFGAYQSEVEGEYSNLEGGQGVDCLGGLKYKESADYDYYCP